MSEHGLRWEVIGKHSIYKTDGCLFAAVPVLEHSVGSARYEVFLTPIGWECTFWHGNRGHNIVMHAQTVQLAQDGAQKHFDKLVNAFLPLAKTQPPWIDLLVDAGCPDITIEGTQCVECFYDGWFEDRAVAKRRECWVAYLKEKYGWEPVEGAEMSIGEHDTCPYCGHSNLIVGKDDAAVKALVDLLKEAHECVCDLLCPSTGKAGVPIKHGELCNRIREAIGKVEGL